MTLKRIILLAVVVFIGGVIVGMLLSGGEASAKKGEAPEHLHGQEDTVWTCSMHPQIRQPEPGDCPICGMDLIPVETDDTETGPRTLKLSETAQKIADIETTPVKREFVDIEMRMSGKIAYDETGIGYITARMGGRVEKMYVNYTGVPVKKGDHIAYLYSPSLFTAQEELLQAVEIHKNAATEEVKQEAQGMVRAAQNKLMLWGVTDTQIEEIRQRGSAREYMDLYAPQGGIVIKKHVEEGSYIKTGSRIYTVADLSRVWVFLDAYESDLQFLKYGQSVEFNTQAYPGRIFKGRISFIDPVLNGKIRIVQVRITVDNEEGLLKPEMFVRAVIKATVTAEGAVVERDLAGKWLCYMHPDIIKSNPGTCDECNMALVSAESLGYVDPEKEHDPPLIIPASAPLITGKRAVVYVRREGDSELFESREVVLGPKAGECYVVKSGLSENEQVVTNGSFKIDSAMQIQAKPSMMSPQQQKTGKENKVGKKTVKTIDFGPTNVPNTFLIQLQPIFNTYFKLQKNLAEDRFRNAVNSAGSISPELKQIDTKALNGKQASAWTKTAEQLEQICSDLSTVDDIETLRKKFLLISQIMIHTVDNLGNPFENGIYMFFCPMAFNNRGAFWLQNNQQLKNPYFGEMMLTCGELKEPFPGSIKEKDHIHNGGDSNHEN